MPLIAVTSRSFSANASLRTELLENFGDCRFNEEGLRLDGDSLVEFLEGAAGAIVGVERLDGSVLERLPGLRVISKFGVGVDTIDLAEASDRGIEVAVTLGTNAEAVAEHALLLAMGSLRRLPEALDGVRDRRWSPVTGRLLSGKTVGLVGVGHVGVALARLLEPFGCEVLGYDTRTGGLEGIDFVTLDALLERSDVVSIHVPLTAETRGMIGQRELGLMRSTAVLVNTSRGAVVDERALDRALSDGVLGAAALDVLAVEPPESWELAERANVFVTPHMAGSSHESNLAMGRAAISGLLANRERLTA
jgi:D-3-phosphoglycerate dehydrogenase